MIYYLGYYKIGLKYTLWCLVTLHVSSVYAHHQEYNVRNYQCLLIWYIGTVMIVYGMGGPDLVYILGV
jgi:hypothetical protein